MHPKIDFEKLPDSFVRLLKVARIESPAARAMAFFEVFLGVFLLIALAMLFAHEIVLAILAAFAKQDFHVDGVAFYVVVASMFLSVVLVAVRESIGKSG